MVASLITFLTLLLLSCGIVALLIVFLFLFSVLVGAIRHMLNTEVKK